jgi:hypothetical protein
MLGINRQELRGRKEAATAAEECQAEQPKITVTEYPPKRAAVEMCSPYLLSGRTWRDRETYQYA